MNQTQKNITVLENQWVTLECLVSSRTSPSSQLAVEWYVWRPGHPEKEAVARLSRQNILRYGDLAALGDLRSRLHLESPSPGLYLLSIQNATVRDSGAYNCRVEEWLLDPSDRWYKRAEDISGLITLTVKQPGEEGLVLTALSSTLPSWTEHGSSSVCHGQQVQAEGRTAALQTMLMLSCMSSWVHPCFSGRSIEQVLHTQLDGLWDFLTPASANLFFYSTFGRSNKIGFQIYSHFD